MNGKIIIFLFCFSFSNLIADSFVTSRDYADFLNITAISDEHHLYDLKMEEEATSGILRFGTPGNYFYAATQEGVSVGYVDAFSAMRYANWKKNKSRPENDVFMVTEYGIYGLAGDQLVTVLGDAPYFVFMGSRESDANLVNSARMELTPLFLGNQNANSDLLLKINQVHFNLLDNKAIQESSGLEIAELGSEDEVGAVLLELIAAVVAGNTIGEANNHEPLHVHEEDLNNREIDQEHLLTMPHWEEMKLHVRSPHSEAYDDLPLDDHIFYTLDDLKDLSEEDNPLSFFQKKSMMIASPYGSLNSIDFIRKQCLSASQSIHNDLFENDSSDSVSTDVSQSALGKRKSEKQESMIRAQKKKLDPTIRANAEEAGVSAYEQFLRECSDPSAMTGTQIRKFLHKAIGQSLRGAGLKAVEADQYVSKIITTVKNRVSPKKEQEISQEILVDFKTALQSHLSKKDAAFSAVRKVAERVCLQLLNTKGHICVCNMENRNIVYPPIYEAFKSLHLKIEGLGDPHHEASRITTEVMQAMFPRAIRQVNPEILADFQKAQKKGSDKVEASYFAVKNAARKKLQELRKACKNSALDNREQYRNTIRTTVDNGLRDLEFTSDQVSQHAGPIVLEVLEEFFPKKERMPNEEVLSDFQQAKESGLSDSEAVLTAAKNAIKKACFKLLEEEPETKRNAATRKLLQEPTRDALRTLGFNSADSVAMASQIITAALDECLPHCSEVEVDEELQASFLKAQENGLNEKEAAHFLAQEEAKRVYLELIERKRHYDARHAALKAVYKILIGLKWPVQEAHNERSKIFSDFYQEYKGGTEGGGPKKN